jgi:hypothetical protein
VLLDGNDVFHLADPEGSGNYYEAGAFTVENHVKQSSFPNWCIAMGKKIMKPFLLILGKLLDIAVTGGNL